MSRPSGAFVMTSCGSTCASAGNPGRAVGKIIFCAAVELVALRAGRRGQMPSDCVMFQLALNVASVLPDASGAGNVSIPCPTVTCVGSPPEVGTAQMWRRADAGDGGAGD